MLAGIRDAVTRFHIADPISLRLDVRMAPKYHPTPPSGGDRKALAKELGKARTMANILTAQSAEMRAKGEAMIQQADRLLCESWNERMWSDGDPSKPLLEAMRKAASQLSGQRPGFIAIQDHGIAAADLMLPHVQRRAAILSLALYGRYGGSHVTATYVTAFGAVMLCKGV